MHFRHGHRGPPAGKDPSEAEAALCCLFSKDLPDNAGGVRDEGSVLGSGRSPGEGKGNPLQYSCLENPMDSGAWRATVHGVEESDTSEASGHAPSSLSSLEVRLSELSPLDPSSRSPVSHLDFHVHSHLVLHRQFYHLIFQKVLRRDSLFFHFLFQTFRFLYFLGCTGSLLGHTGFCSCENNSSSLVSL